MAEIRIEKKATSAWTWLLPLLLVGAGLWWFFGRGNGADVGSGIQPDSSGAVSSTGMTDSAGAYSGARSSAGGAATGSVADFATFVGAQSATRDENEQHRFTAGGIRRLAQALESLESGAGTSTKLADMRAQANALESSAVGSDRHADMTRTAFLAAADVFAMIPTNRVSAVATSQIRAAAEAMSAGPTLLGQKDKIDAFFSAAAKALRAGPA